MAKKFSIVYEAAKETAYGQAQTALVVMASLNSMIDFIPVNAPNGTVDMGATTAEYNIQRIKRIKGATVANANSGTTSAALAALDGFSKVDWETIGVATGALRSVGVKTGINEEFDIDALGSAHQKAVSDSVALEAIERHEKLIEEAYNNSQYGGALVWTANDTKLFDTITDTAEIIQLKSDDFKHMTLESNMVILMHPTVAKNVAKEIGTVFNQEAPIYKTGFKSQNSINGIPVIVDSNLNKYQDTDETKRLGAIIMDAEAMAFKAANETNPISIDLGLTKYSGKFFYDITKAVDTGRIYSLSFDAGTLGKTKKVSE